MIVGVTTEADVILYNAVFYYPDIKYFNFRFISINYTCYYRYIRFCVTKSYSCGDSFSRDTVLKLIKSDAFFSMIATCTECLVQASTSLLLVRTFKEID